MRQRTFIIALLLMTPLIILGLLSKKTISSAPAQSASYQRVYLINQDDPSKPAKIAIGSASEPTKIMRAPLMEIAARKEPAQARQDKQPEEPRQAVQRFRPREVIGRTSNPRVAFDQQRLDLNRVEQQYRIEFLERALNALPPEL